MKTKQGGVVRCLGWCNKEFYSPDKVRIRFCKKCRTKKEANERSMHRVKTVGEGLPHGFFSE